MNENNQNENLVSVESQSEYSITTGKRETRIFFKMYIDAVHSGLVGDIGPERLQTLIVIAAFMDENGECYPTQYAIAERLNVARETANRRIKSLCDYRWKGRPIVQKVQSRDHDKQTWENVRYTILPISGLEKFGGPKGES